jgi:hypothetical protein
VPGSPEQGIDKARHQTGIQAILQRQSGQGSVACTGGNIVGIAAVVMVIGGFTCCKFFGRKPGNRSM